MTILLTLLGIHLGMSVLGGAAVGIQEANKCNEQGKAARITGVMLEVWCEGDEE